MDIIAIITEEAKRLFDQRIYNMQDLAKLVGDRQGYDKEGIGYLTNMLLREYKRGGDPAVIKMYGSMSGVEIEAVTNGRYMFANLHDPEQLKEIEDNACHTPDEMPS